MGWKGQVERLTPSVVSTDVELSGLELRVSGIVELHGSEILNH